MNYFLQRISYIVLLSCILLSCNTKTNTNFQLKEGDLLFQNTGSDDIDNAIKDVTATASAKNYSHVGMAMQKRQQMVCGGSYT
tara:strand:+ start:20592 stop:20840 length:249 start_codon:yes stop_codon:yes gene_type:complete